MVTDVDMRLVRAVRRADEERQARLRVEHAMRALRGQLNVAKRLLVMERAKTMDAKPKPPASSQ